jgi:hypothetical protein
MPFKDKEDAKRWGKQYYKNRNKDYLIQSKEHQRLLKIEKRNHVTNYLSKHPCVDCGETDPIVLEFDHVSGKKKNNVSNLVNQSYSLDLVKAEIEKCVVRCANCHRRITYKRRNNLA